MNTTIYCLRCPDTNAVRYVGKTTKRLAYRKWKHVHDPADNHRTRWLRSLIAQGKQPVLEVLEVVEDDDWPNRERWWIAEMRRRGADLVNATDGGRGAPGRVLTELHKARIGTSNSGRKSEWVTVSCAWCGAELERSPWQVTHSKSGLFFCNHSHKSLFCGPLRKPLSDEARARMSASRKGFKHTEEAKAKIGAACRGKKMIVVDGKKKRVDAV